MLVEIALLQENFIALIAKLKVHVLLSCLNRSSRAIGLALEQVCTNVAPFVKSQAVYNRSRSAPNIAHS